MKITGPFDLEDLVINWKIWTQLWAEQGTSLISIWMQTQFLHICLFEVLQHLHIALQNPRPVSRTFIVPFFNSQNSHIIISSLPKLKIILGKSA